MSDFQLIKLADKTFFPYQEETIIKQARHKEKQHAVDKATKGVVNHPTGTGKSITSMGIIGSNYHPAQHRSIFMAPQINLVHQFANNVRANVPDFNKTYRLSGIEYASVGTVMANLNHPEARLVVASVPTVIPRSEQPTEDDIANEMLATPIQRSDFDILRNGGIVLSPSSSRKYLVSSRMDQILEHGYLSCIVYDEAHHAVADQTMQMFWRLQDIHTEGSLPPLDVIGLTATMYRPDDKGLMNLFDVIYDIRTTEWAQREGYLAPFANPAVVSVSIDTGYGEDQLKSASNWDEQMYEAIMDIMPERQILVFMDSMPGFTAIQATRHFARYLSSRGLPAASTDSMMTVDEHGNELKVSQRGEIYQRFMNREIRVIVAYSVGLEGLDLPIADGLFWMRRSNEPHLMIQAVGRVLRVDPRKLNAMILDGVGRGIDITPVGSLFGYKLNRNGDYEKKEVSEEDEFAEFVIREEVQLLGKGNIYTEGKIKSKSPNRWHSDLDTNRWYLSLNTSGDALCILPPDYANLTTIRDRLDALSLVEAGEPNPYSPELNPTLDTLYWYFKEKVNPEEYGDMRFLLQFFESLYAKYTLWHINTSNHTILDESGQWIAEDDDLMRLVLRSNQLMGSLDGVAKSFISKKSKGWDDEATPAQINLINRRRMGDVYPGMTKAQAGGMISAYFGNGMMDTIIKELTSVWKVNSN